MDIFIQVLVSGSSAGSIYALLALGIVLLYKTSKILNFAHGELGLLGSFIAYTVFSKFGLPYVLSFLLSLLAAGLISGLLAILFVKPERKAVAFAAALLAFGLALAFDLHWIISAVVGAIVLLVAWNRLSKPEGEQGELGLVIVSLGLALAIQGADALLFGTDNKVLPSLFSKETISFLGASLSISELLSSFVGIGIMLLLWLFLNKTKIGLAMRAVAQSEEIARAMGIPVRTVMFAAWAASAILAAAAASLLIPKTLLAPGVMLGDLSKAFVASVIGGMTSLPGAILGGYILGILEVVIGYYINAELQASFAFLVVILVLIFRPHGILGEPEIKRV